MDKTQNISADSDLTDMGGCPETGIHRYLDNDLPVPEQPGVFKHLASCTECRNTMDSVLAFRRMSRQEHISLPPLADEAFFTRLALLKTQNDKMDRSADRAPLWSARRSVSLRAAAGLAIGVFLFGLMLPMPERTTRPAPLIQMSAETVDFGSSDSMVILTHIYTYIDGPTVEGERESIDATDELLPR